MGFREWTNNHPKTTYGIVGGCVLACIGAIGAEVLAGRRSFPTSMPDAYFTTDDGKSYFQASMTNYPPFQHDGAEAVRAYVFESNHGKKFVGFLERYTADSKKYLDTGKAPTPQIQRFGREIKRPGETKWSRTGNMMLESKIEDVVSPDGDSAPNNVEP